MGENIPFKSLETEKINVDKNFELETQSVKFSTFDKRVQFLNGDHRLKMSLNNINSSSISADLCDEPFILWKTRQKVQYRFDVRGDKKNKCVHYKLYIFLKYNTINNKYFKSYCSQCKSCKLS